MYVKPAKARTFTAKRDSEILNQKNDFDKKVVGEIKRNGWRLIVSSEVCYTATGHKKQIPWIQKQIPKGYVIDGEIAFDDFSKDSSDVTHALSDELFDDLYFFAFDLLATPEISQEIFMEKGFIYRRGFLEMLFHHNNLGNKIRLNEIWYDKFPERIEELKQAGAEGMMFKYLDRPYKPGSRANMVKYKFFDDYDVVIVDAEGKPSEWRVRPGDTGTDGRTYPDGLHTESWDKGYVNLRYGLYCKETGELKILGSLGVTGPKEELSKHVGKVARVKAYAQFPTGCLQHPVFLEYRDPADKSADECVFEFNN